MTIRTNIKGMYIIRELKLYIKVFINVMYCDPDKDYDS